MLFNTFSTHNKAKIKRHNRKIPRQRLEITVTMYAAGLLSFCLRIANTTFGSTFDHISDTYSLTD